MGISKVALCVYSDLAINNFWKIVSDFFLLHAGVKILNNFFKGCIKLRRAEQQEEMKVVLEAPARIKNYFHPCLRPHRR